MHPSPGSGAGRRAGSEIRLKLRWGGNYMSQMSMAVFTVCLCVCLWVLVHAHTHAREHTHTQACTHAHTHTQAKVNIWCLQSLISLSQGPLTEPSIHQTVRLTGRSTRNVCLSCHPPTCVSPTISLGLHNHMAMKVLGIQTRGLMLEQWALH